MIDEVNIQREILAQNNSDATASSENNADTASGVGNSNPALYLNLSPINNPDKSIPSAQLNNSDAVSKLWRNESLLAFYVKLQKIAEFNGKAGGFSYKDTRTIFIGLRELGRRVNCHHRAAQRNLTTLQGLGLVYFVSAPVGYSITIRLNTSFLTIEKPSAPVVRHSTQKSAPPQRGLQSKQNQHDNADVKKPSAPYNNKKCATMYSKTSYISLSSLLIKNYLSGLTESERERQITNLNRVLKEYDIETVERCFKYLTEFGIPPHCNETCRAPIFYLLFNLPFVLEHVVEFEKSEARKAETEIKNKVRALEKLIRDLGGDATAIDAIVKFNTTHVSLAERQIACKDVYERNFKLFEGLHRNSDLVKRCILLIWYQENGEKNEKQ